MMKHKRNLTESVCSGSSDCPICKVFSDKKEEKTIASESIKFLSKALIRSARLLNNTWKKKIAGYVRQVNEATKDTSAASEHTKEFLMIKGNILLTDIRNLFASASLKETV